MAEPADILGRRIFEPKVSASLLAVDQLVDCYAELVAVARPASTSRNAPDPDDDVVIGTALAARTDLIITGDRLLLSMIKYQGIRIVGVCEALQAIAAA